MKTKPDKFKFKLYFINAFQELKNFCKSLGKLEAIILYFIVTLFLIYCFKYISVKFYYDFSRGFPDKGLLIFQSFFTTTRSPLIPFIMLPKGYPLTEQQAYIGFVPIIIFALGLYFKVFNKTTSINKDIFVSGLVLFILFFSIGPLNIYFIIYNLPGLDGLRHPSRVIFILLFPIALFIGVTIDNLFSRYLKIIPLFIVCLFWGEVYASKKSKSNIEIETNLDKSYFKNLKSLNEEDILVFKNTSEGQWDVPLENSVSLYAAKKNIKVMNGHTSFVPKGLGRYENCKDIKTALKHIENYKKNGLILESKIGYWRIIPIGFEKSCKEIIFKN